MTVVKIALSLFGTLFLLVSQCIAQCPDSATQDLAFDSYNNHFYVSDGNSAYYRDHTGATGPNPYFWPNAEMLEMAEDAYDRSSTQQNRDIVAALVNGFIERFGTDWSYNEYNDDIMWAAIAFARAKVITGNDQYGQIGASNFNMVWDRAWDTELGGGLWWRTDKLTKNACVNGPGAIAAMHFYRVNYGANYLTQAQQIYSWLRATLFWPDSGKVDDHITSDGQKIGWTFTYNQGTFAGAGALLFDSTRDQQYADDGRLAIQFTRTSLTGEHGTPDILNDEYNGGDGNGDGVGFKGIFTRWAKEWRRVTSDTQFDSWLQLNARACWDYRNSNGVTWAQWWHRTPDDYVTAWECSSASAMLQNCR